MIINVHYDIQRLKEYHARGSGLPFFIHWEENGVCYPDNTWTDFGATLLSWWLVGLHRLQAGSLMERFLFMEGPCQLIAQQDGSSIFLTPPKETFIWQTTLGILTEVLVPTARQVHTQLNEITHGNRDLLELEKALSYS